MHQDIYKSLVKESVIGYAQLDQSNMNVIDVNSSFCEIVGLEKSLILNQEIPNVLLENNYYYSKELDKHFQITQVNIEQAIVIYLTDISKIHRQLMTKTSQLKLVLNASIEGIISFDHKFKCTFCNKAALKLLDLVENEVLGKNIKSIIRNKVETITSEYPKEVSYSKNGTTKYFEYNIHAINTKAYKGRMLSFYDITQRKQIEKELLDNEKNKATLLNNLPGMAYRCNFDRDWTMELVSKGCYELTGYKPESLINNRDISFNHLIMPEFREYLWNKWQKVLHKKTTFKEEYIITTADCREKWVLEQAHIIYDDENKALAIEGFIIDISDLKKKQEEIEFLSYHDHLTGIYNRSYFEKAITFYEQQEYLPLTLIIGDINNLKLINDAIGHAEGDKLLIETAKLLKRCCRPKDILARISGDEFVILMPNTTSEYAHKLTEEINKQCETYNVNKSEIYRISISLGYATKEQFTENFDNVRKIAEDYMYQRKLLDRNSSHSALIASITTSLQEKSQETEMHAQRLQFLSKQLGVRMGISPKSLDELSLLATLHDIGKIGISDKILKKPGKLTAEEWVEMKKHPEIGYRIAMASPELIAIAEYILSHHERWDGKGYPRGLKADEIPFIARVLSVVDAYDAMTEYRPYRTRLEISEALAEIENNSGTQFDPKIAKTFIEMVTENLYFYRK